jgi:acyl-ACP thioesterase
VTDAMMTELVGRPPDGRVFEQLVRPGFADCAPSGRMRLDGLARWLQDVAYADVEDAGLAEKSVWVVRRTRIDVRRFPRFGEEFELATFCSGMGRMWAERRTTIARAGAEQSDVEAVALWVHLEPESWRPVPLGEQELEQYGTAAAGRRVTARLRHPAPDGAAAISPWLFRDTELDIAGHVNNAAYWTPLEEELLGGPEPTALDVEIEFRTPGQPGTKRVLRAGPRRWIVDPSDEVLASVLVRDRSGPT